MTITQNLCPRCGGLMRPVMDVRSTVFEGCLMCGYEDYQHEPPKTKAKSPVHHVRYGGPDSFLQDLGQVIPVEVVVDGRSQLVYRPSCPFCGADMKQVSLSGKRHNLMEERYLCEVGHRISLIPADDGMLEWM